MLLRLIPCPMGQGLRVIEHRAEIAHVDPAFTESEVELPPSDVAAERDRLERAAVSTRVA